MPTVAKVESINVTRNRRGSNIVRIEFADGHGVEIGGGRAGVIDWAKSKVNVNDPDVALALLILRRGDLRDADISAIVGKTITLDVTANNPLQVTQ